MNRGARRENVLEPLEHAGLFVHTVGEMALRHAIEVHAYAVMSNHYHLLLHSVRGNLSRAMQFLGARFTQELNRHSGWDGPIFHGRFRNQVLRDERAILTVAGYIHLNPLRAGIVRRLDQHCWTSHRAYLGLDYPPDWLSRDLLLGHCGGSEAFGEWVYDLRSKREGWPEDFDEDNGWFAGGKEVRPWSFKRRDVKDRVVPKKPADAARVLKRVMRLTKSNRRELNRAPRGRSGNPARRFAVWALHRETGLKHSQIGDLLGGMNPEQVGVTLARLREAERDATVQRWIDTWLATP